MIAALGTVKHATIQFFQPRGLPTMKVKLVALTALVALTSNIANANEPIVVNQAVTEKEALTAQQAWCAALLDINCGRKIKCHPNYRTLQRSNSCKNPFKTMTYFNSAICKRFVGMEAGIIKVSS